VRVERSSLFNCPYGRERGREAASVKQFARLAHLQLSQRSSGSRRFEKVDPSVQKFAGIQDVIGIKHTLDFCM
jgi:hypothetical protein